MLIDINKPFYQFLLVPLTFIMPRIFEAYLTVLAQENDDLQGI